MALDRSQSEALSEVMTAAFPDVCARKALDCSAEKVLKSAVEAEVVNKKVDQALATDSSQESIFSINASRRDLSYKVRNHLAHRWWHNGNRRGSLSTAIGALKSLNTFILRDLAIGGSIVDEIGQLDSLTTLSLGQNEIEGTIPEGLSKLSRLRTLDLENNRLEGTLPSKFGLLENLEYLNVRKQGGRFWGVANSTGLHGQVPSELSGLTKLKELHICHNNFEGMVAGWIYNFHGMRTLRFEKNSFEGPIPSEIGDLKQIRVLQLWGNDMQGDVPSTIGKLVDMKELYITTSQGSLPSEVGNLRALQDFTFRAEKKTDTYAEGRHSLQVTGTLPSELGRLSKLKTVYGEETRLSGTLPTELGNLASLVEMQLPSCKLQGRLPTELIRIPTLHHLTLSSNKLTGSFFESVDRSQSLSILDLRYNSLSGSIAGSLEKVSFQRFELDNNNLQGPLPTRFSADITDINMAEIKLGFNSLSGQIPSDLGKTWLWEFSVRKNELSGSLPTELGLIRGRLFIFDVHQNRLIGSISHIGLQKIPNLAQPDMSSNRFSGVLPELSDIMTFPRFSENSFEGQLPVFSVRTEVIQLSGNRLTGSLPSDLGKLKRLRELSLAQNLLEGSIPEQFGDMSVAAYVMMHSNYLEKSIPPEIGKLPALEVLTLHDNRIDGRVPFLHFTQTIMHTLSGPVVSLFGNRLSCELPNIELQDFDEPPQALFNLGNNFFEEPQPAWLRGTTGRKVRDNDTILYVPRSDLLPLMLLTVLGFLLLLVSVCGALKRGTLAFVLEEIVKKRRERLLDRTHWSLILVLSCMTIVGLCGLLPAFARGEKFYACGSTLAQTHASYMSPGTVSSLIVVLCWGAHLTIGFVYCQIMPVNVKSKSAKRTVARDLPCHRKYGRKLSKLLWIFLALLFAAPTIGYAFMLTTPSDNVIASWLHGRQHSEHVKVKLEDISNSSSDDFLTRTLGKNYMWNVLVMKVGTPFVTSLIEAFILEPFSVRYSLWGGVSPAWLLAAGFTMNLWLVPTFVLLILHENCFGYWRYLWNPCNMEFSNLELYGDSSRPLMGPADFCAPPSMRQMARRSTCIRSVIQTLAPFIARKLVYRHLLFQALWVQMWVNGKRNERGQFRFMKYIPLDDPIMAHRQLAYINLWSITAILWGPLIPLLNPVLLMMLLSEFLVYKLGVEHFNVAEEGSHVMIPSREFMTIAVAFTSLFLFIFALEVHLPMAYPLLSFMLVLVGQRSWKKMHQQKMTKSEKTISEVELADLSNISSDEMANVVSTLSLGVPIDLSSFSSFDLPS